MSCNLAYSSNPVKTTLEKEVKVGRILDEP
jgi:hypothetical protein